MKTQFYKNTLKRPNFQKFIISAKDKIKGYQNLFDDYKCNRREYKLIYDCKTLQFFFCSLFLFVFCFVILQFA